jgi:purine-binding chemotaxis protein CheW
MGAKGKVMDINEKKDLNEKQYLTFDIADETYGLFLKDSKEIIKKPVITNVPNTADHILGVINLRGQVVPVVSLKKKLGLAKEEDENLENRKIIITNINDIIIGVLVDNVREVLTLNVDKIEEMTDSRRGLKEDFIEGVVNYQDSLLVIVNIEKILFADSEDMEVEDRDV